MSGGRLATPWARPSALYSAPGSLILKLALGEAPEAIPAVQDVRAGVYRPATELGVGPVDRMLSRFSDWLRVTRLYGAAAAVGRPGRGHNAFDALEHATGLARTFRVETSRDCAIGDMVDGLRQLGVVEAVSPRYLCVLPFARPPAATVPVRAWTDPDEAWASRDQVHLAEAMAFEPGDAACVIGLLDTGVAADHPELRTRLRPGRDVVQIASPDLAAGIQLLGDYHGRDDDPDDELGHGTACAGIIGAAGLGLPPGLAGACGLLPIRVLATAQLPGRATRVGLGALSDIDFGLKLAMDLGAKVLNMSFGTPMAELDPADPVPHADVVRYGLARGCVLVAASGNSGAVERFTPAALDGVIAIGAAGADGRPASFSTRGPHVALSAPGERVRSAGLQGDAMVTGTSFAAPFAAAAAALLVCRAARRAATLDSGAAGRLLRVSAAPWPAGTGAGHGAGVLDAWAALRALERELNQVVTEAPPGDVVQAGARGP
jgi:subtilisin family serine protease